LAVADEGKYLCTSSVELNRAISKDTLEFMRKGKVRAGFGGKTLEKFTTWNL
jgi:hypothetical protein